jgi:hypothetical protein
MSDPPETATLPGIPPRVRKILEAVYAVEGVAAARVWVWSGKVAVGVRGTSAIAIETLLKRVESAVVRFREVDETWEFGVLDDAED